MGISASSLNISNSNLFRSIPTPGVNTAEISMGAVRTPYSTALAPSNTAYGTNANPILSTTPYTSSAAVLQANTVVNNNAITTQNSIETGSDLQNALSLIAQQTPGSKFSNSSGVFTTNKTVETQPQTQVFSNSREFSASSTFSPTQTSSNIFESRISLTGRNATIGAETAANFASVNANLNVKYSQQGNQALQALQSLATISALQGTNVQARMDGMIPLAPSTLTDFSGNTSTATSNSRVIDTLTETFNNIMKGGGQGGGGLSYSKKDESEPEKQEQKKRINFMG